MGHHDPDPLSLDVLARDPGRASLLSTEARATLLSQVVTLLFALGAPSPTTERLLTVAEAASMLGCSRDNLYRNKRHPARVQNGRSVRYSLRALERFIAQRRGPVA